jgi:methionine synthase II (cobalamin-independent)
MTPPFRADQVGSLLRPRRLAEARAAFRQGKLEAAALSEDEQWRKLGLVVEVAREVWG